MANADSILVAIRVTSPQAKLLEFIADRGAEIPWEWQNCRPDVVAMVTELVEKRLISDLRDQRKIRLTDQGRSAVSQIRQATQRATATRS